ncbi:thrombospondin-1-like [Hydra vulgaris]|uniref:thrombospondin-1-like n=1 Tax=Hydra vulgaris TaxID=6087 RepID=UPI001F5E8C00|nr:thrombospondin-1-like [Hydra vulgaris]
MWGEWKYQPCSKSCGSGIKFYNRVCDNPRPSINGRHCMGVSSFTEDCNSDIICPVNGNWSMWSSWSLCSQPCGGGVKLRFRSCSSPMPRFGGWDCVGSVKDSEVCAIQNCKSAYLNINVNFIEVYTDFQLPILSVKIQDAIAHIYRSWNMNRTFNVIIHSIENRP